MLENQALCALQTIRPTSSMSMLSPISPTNCTYGTLDDVAFPDTSSIAHGSRIQAQPFEYYEQPTAPDSGIPNSLDSEEPQFP